MGKFRQISFAGFLSAATLLAPGAEASHGYRVLYNFCHDDGCTDGANPDGLIADASGNLYGTTEFGGINGNGVVFKFAPDGTETVLYAFCQLSNCDDGYEPTSTLLRDSSGNLYGTTFGGGPKGGGTVFELAPDGTETVIYAFCVSCAQGGQPNGGLVIDDQGNLYGTTSNGGTGGLSCGVAFKIDPKGNETVLHDFGASRGDGCNPLAPLLRSRGSLFGTTSTGGAKGQGTVFEITSKDKYKVLYSFCPKSGCPDGKTPQSSLIRDSAGTIYGTTYAGGAHRHGTVFALSGDGTETVLYSFCAQAKCADGADPFAGLFQDGPNLLGTTVAGGAGNGVVFSLSNGTETVRHAFSGKTDGGQPYAGVIKLNGFYYGTTTQCCGIFYGTIFKLGTTSGGER